MADDAPEHSGGSEGSVEEDDVVGLGGEEEEEDDRFKSFGGSDGDGAGAGAGVGVGGEDDEEEGEGEGEAGVEAGKKGKKTKKVITDKDLSKFEKREKRKGVIYLARVPPYMKPVKVRHLMSQFGEVGRIYLKPEDAAKKARRIKKGGSKKEKFTEGWIEFARKSIAKRVAASLNNTPVTNKKGDFHATDLWNLKYLHRFKWNDLTEQMAYEQRIKTQKLRREMAEAKRDVAEYMEKVEKAKQITKMEDRKRAAGKGDAVDREHKRSRRRFHQKAALPDSGDRAALSAKLLKKVLSK